MSESRGAFAVGGGGVESVGFRDETVGDPGPGEALVRITAASLNYRDYAMLTQPELGKANKKPDYVPLSCGAGDVIAVGDGVIRVSVGDRVSPTMYVGQAPSERPQGRGTSLARGGPTDGVARELMVVDVEQLVRIPDGLSDLEAATLPCAGLTAWNALNQVRAVRAGDWVLAPGTGGVSIAALQFAKAAGARVISTSSSDAKLARTRALGADITINYRTSPDWREQVRRELGGHGLDVVVEVVGEFRDNASLLNEDGILSVIGFVGADFGAFDDSDIKDVTVAQIAVGSRDDHESMHDFIAEHGVRPIVDQVYDLARLRDALEVLDSGRFFGKVDISLR